MKEIKKVIRNDNEFQFTDVNAQASIDNIVEELNKLEIPDKLSDLENDMGYINEVKTINNQSIVGQGNIEIKSGSKITELEYKQGSGNLFLDEVWNHKLNWDDLSNNWNVNWSNIECYQNFGVLIYPKRIDGTPEGFECTYTGKVHFSIKNFIRFYGEGNAMLAEGDWYETADLETETNQPYIGVRHLRYDAEWDSWNDIGYYMYHYKTMKYMRNDEPLQGWWLYLNTDYEDYSGNTKHFEGYIPNNQEAARAGFDSGLGLTEFDVDVQEGDRLEVQFFSYNHYMRWICIGEVIISDGNNNTIFKATDEDKNTWNIDTNLTLPSKVSELENDEGYIKNTKTINNESIQGEGNISLPTQNDINNINDRIDELQLFKFPNATIFGQPTIQNGQVSNFSNANYLQFPFLVDFQNKPFEIYFSFTTGNDISGQQNILDSNYGLAFATRNDSLVVVASEDGTTWSTGELIESNVVSANTTYYIIILWNINVLQCSYSLDKSEWHLLGAVNMSNTPYPKTMYIGRSYVNNGNYFKGSINLNDASLTIASKVVWTGMDDVGLATRAAVDLSNLDDKGKEVIDNRIDNKIVTKQDTLQYVNEIPEEKVVFIGDIDIETFNPNGCIIGVAPDIIQLYAPNEETPIEFNISGEGATINGEPILTSNSLKTINNQSIIGEGNITIQGGGSSNIVNLTQAEYDALETKDPNTIYNITDATDINVYTKEEIDNKGYLIQETDPIWNSEKNNYYTKSDVYNKTEIDNKIGNIENLLSQI